MSPKVLITGGAGYLGGRIAADLTAWNKFSIRLTIRENEDNHSLYVPENEIVAMDLLKDEQIRAACKGVYCIIHLAAMNEIDCAKDPEKGLAVNGLGTLRLIRMAETEGVERFVYISTAHVYGAPLQGIITEDTLPRPVHPYAITHRVAEDFVFSALSRRSMQGIVIRLSNALGSPVHPSVNRWSLVANDLCRQVVTTGKIQLHSPGVQKRDFVPLVDVCAAIRHFIELPGAKLGNGLFNLGGEHSLRIMDLAEIIAERTQEIFGFKPPIIRPSLESGEGMESSLIYSIDKLKSTGFRLEGNIKNAIDETLLFCAKYFGDGKI
jgi:UDP-glucose 4-epimerase